jgi:trehalose 6-phosphate synthase/phosphatase
MQDRSWPPGVAAALARLRAAATLRLLLDYDGTLVNLTPHPAEARPDPALLSLLAELAARPGTVVHVVSGRPRETIAAWLGPLPIYLHAEHGYWSRAPGEGWVPLEEARAAWWDGVLGVLREFAATTPGALIEEKTVGLAWHYRMADPELGTRQAQDLSRRLARLFPADQIEVLSGSKVVEVRPPGVNKGVVARQVAARAGGALLAAFGDDRTDEDLFAALPAGSIALHVGPGPSLASLWLEDVPSVRRFLSRVLAAPA